jgi:hypothetical protein
MDADRVIAVAAQAVAAVNDSETVLHNLETGVSYRLDEIGTRIWELIESGGSIATITATIRAEYALPSDIAPEQVEHDVVSMLSELQRYGLVELGSPTAHGT